MPGRYKEYDWSRIGMQGQAKDDEIYGKGNFVNYAERQYDPRLLRWPMPDKLFAKYPSTSPYAFVNNSPIMNKEIDGRDYALYINHTGDAKTIIVKATYYTTKGDATSSESAKDATQFWNNKSGKYQYVVGEGDERVVYDIVFLLDVQEVQNPTKELNTDRLPSEEAVTLSMTKLTPDASSNKYQVLPDNSDKFNNSAEGQTTNATTREGRSIYVKNSQKAAPSGSHEVGHTLGLEHFSEGLMTLSSNDPKRTSTISEENIQGIIGNAINRVSESAGTGSVTPPKNRTI